MQLEADVLPWLGAAALACAVGSGLLLCLPLRFDLQIRARGEANGSWAVAGGASFSVLSVALAAARGVSPKLTFFIFGKRLELGLSGWYGRASRPVPKRVKAASLRAWSKLRPLDLALKMLDQRRHLRLRYLVVDLEYGFRDPLLTGRLLGALYALSGVLPASIELRQRPRWDFEDGWQARVEARALVKPGLMLLGLAAYVVQMLLLPKRSGRKLAPLSTPSEVR